MGDGEGTAVRKKTWIGGKIDPRQVGWGRTRYVDSFFFFFVRYRNRCKKRFWGGRKRIGGRGQGLEG